MKIYSRTMACALALFSSLNASVASTSDISEIFEFDVYLEDERIGNHTVVLEAEGEQKKVTTTASFVYTILFLPVYTYDHRTVETWNGACLNDINSTTDDNGDTYFINSSRIDQQTIRLSTQSGDKDLAECIRTYAYWDNKLLKSNKLLNTQNGEYQQASIVDHGEAILEFETTRIKANRYELTTEEGNIILWYDDNDKWIALESKVSNGSVIRYLSTELKPHEDDA